jgi:hypothetical protein
MANGQDKVWTTRQSRQVLSTPGSDRDDHARTYFLTDGKQEAQVTVEFAAGRRGSPHRAVTALRPFLRREEKPPRRLLVYRDGHVEILEGAG